MADTPSRFTLFRPSYLKIVVPAVLFLLAAILWPSAVMTVVAPFLIGLVLAYMFNPVVRWIDETVDRVYVIHRVGSVVVLYLVAALVIVTLGTVVGNIVVSETRSLAGNLSRYIKAVVSTDAIRVTLGGEPLLAGWVDVRGATGTADTGRRADLSVKVILPADAGSGPLLARHDGEETPPFWLPVLPLGPGARPIGPSTFGAPFRIDRVISWPGAKPVIAAATADILVLELAGVPVQGPVAERRFRRIADLVPPTTTRDLILVSRPENLLAFLESEVLPSLSGADYSTAARRAGSVAAGAWRATSSLVSGLTAGTAILVNLVTLSLLVLVITFYLLVDYDRMGLFVKSLIPEEHKAYYLRLADDIDEQLGGFLRGQFLVSACVGVLAALGLWTLSWFFPIKYPVLIGLWAGVFNIVPYLGPFMGLVPAVLLSSAEIYSTGEGSILWCTVAIVVLFSLIQTIDGFFITPRIMSDAVDMHPMVVLLALLAGGQLLGILGMLMAVPAACVLRVVLREIYRPGHSGAEERAPDARATRRRRGRGGRRSGSRAAGRERGRESGPRGGDGA